MTTTPASPTKKELKAQRKAEKLEKKRKKKEVKERERDKFRRLRTIEPYTRIVPYIMENRIGSQNFIFDKINMAPIDA